MQYSVVNYSDIPTFDKRIDPEFYEPKNIKLETQLRKINSIPLGELCDLFDGPFGSELLSSSYSENGVPALRMQNVTKYGLPKLDNVEFISDQDADRLTKHIAYAGEVVTTKIGFLGYSTVLPDSYDRYFFRRELTRLVIKNGVNLQPHYLATFLNTSYGRTQALRYSTGTTRDRVLLVNQRHMLIPVFSNKFQRLISNWIVESHKIIELSESKFKEAENIVLSELGLTNWQPKHQLTFIKNYSDTQQAQRIDAEYYQPKYDEIIKAIKNYSGGWRTLDEFIDSYSTGYPFSSKSYVDNGIYLIRINNILKNQLDLSNAVKIPSQDAELSKKDIALKNDILISMSGTIGNACKIPQGIKAIINQRIFKFTPKNYNFNVLTLIINSDIGLQQLLRIGTGGVQTNISGNDIKNIIIPILPKEKQTQIQQKITESNNLRKQSKYFLESAKKAVEMSIEQDEQTAIKWLQKEMQTIGVTDADRL